MAVNYSDVGPTCLKIKDMIRYGYDIMDRWPPFFRYKLGELIQESMLNMLRLATEARLKYYSKTTLQKLDVEKEILRAFIDQANSTTFCDRTKCKRQLLSDHSRTVWMEKINEIGRLIGGWKNGIEKNRENTGN